MQKYIPLLLVLFICLCAAPVTAQIRLEGRVTDEITGEPVPFANVVFQGTSTGTTTDEEGYYQYRSKQRPADTLLVTSIGFRNAKAFVKNDSSLQVINFMLYDEGVALNEFVYVAPENPAFEILRRIHAKKPQNRIDELSAYEAERYTKLEMDLENFDSNFTKRKILKPFDFIFENIDSTGDEKPYLPIYMNETLSKIYYSKGDGRIKEVTQAQRTSGVDNQTLIEYADRIRSEFSIYDDWIYFLEKPFPGPLAENGRRYYEYYLTDSLTQQADSLTRYRIKFKPKARQESAFTGHFWVVDSFYAVEHIEMKMNDQANLNFVGRLGLELDYRYEQGRYLPARENLVVSFQPTKKALSAVARRTMTYKDYVLEATDGKARYEDASEFYVLDNVKNDEETYWQGVRHEPLSENEAGVYAMVDSIQNVPVFQTYERVIEAIFGGYYQLGNIELGSYSSLYSSNIVEGSRFRLGVRTSTDFSEEVRLSGSVAYGLKDEEFKFGFKGEWLVSQRPRIYVGGGYLDDISLSSENSEDFRESDIFSGLFRRDIPQKLIRIREGKFFYERYYENGFSNRLVLLNRQMDPYGGVLSNGGGFNYAFYDDIELPSSLDTTINTTELIFKLRYAFEENFIDGRFERYSVGSEHPIVELQYTWGISNVMGSEYDYQKLNLSYRHFFYMNPLGWMSYRVRAGKTWGKVPFLLANVYPGNEGLFSDRNSFNMMNRYEFASDTYATLMIEHHFDGFILDKIPLIRKLKWRTMASFKAAWGTLTDENLEANFPNLFSPLTVETYSGFRTPDSEPYMEASVGIENIFRFFRVEAMWRLNYLDNPQANKFGVRVGVAFYF